MAQDTVIVGGGSRSMKIRLAPEGLLLLPGASVVEGLANVVEVARG
jgi:prolyl-tRNA editing enzyme YbaK/EbsC (Cys-tRNA(Pro) deacylase)